MRQYAGVILIAQDGKVLLQKRDAKPNISNPGKIGIFGGTREENETLVDCALREINEEVGLKVTDKDLTFLKVYKTKDKNNSDIESHIFLVHNVNLESLTLNEGESIFILDPHIDFTNLNLTRVGRLALDDYLRTKTAENESR